MTKQELLWELERIKDGLLDGDTIHHVEGMCDDIENLMWQINVNTGEF